MEGREKQAVGEAETWCYWRTRSPQDVIVEQTEALRTISINKIYATWTQSDFFLLISLNFFAPVEDDHKSVINNIRIYCLSLFQHS